MIVGNDMTNLLHNSGSKGDDRIFLKKRKGCQDQTRINFFTQPSSKTYYVGMM